MSQLVKTIIAVLKSLKGSTWTPYKEALSSNPSQFKTFDCTRLQFSLIHLKQKLSCKKCIMSSKIVSGKVPESHGLHNWLSHFLCRPTLASQLRPYFLSYKSFVQRFKYLAFDTPSIEFPVFIISLNPPIFFQKIKMLFQ